MSTFSEVLQVKVLTLPYAEFGRLIYDGGARCEPNVVILSYIKTDWRLM